MEIEEVLQISNFWISGQSQSPSEEIKKPENNPPLPFNKSSGDVSIDENNVMKPMLSLLNQCPLEEVIKLSLL